MILDQYYFDRKIAHYFLKIEKKVQIVAKDFSLASLHHIKSFPQTLKILQV